MGGNRWSSRHRDSVSSEMAAGDVSLSASAAGSNGLSNEMSPAVSFHSPGCACAEARRASMPIIRQNKSNVQRRSAASRSWCIIWHCLFKVTRPPGKRPPINAASWAMIPISKVRSNRRLPRNGAVSLGLRSFLLRYSTAIVHAAPATAAPVVSISNTMPAQPPPVATAIPCFAANASTKSLASLSPTPLRWR